MHQKLFDIITQQVNLTDADITLCRTYFEPVAYPKNMVVEEDGKVPQYLYFVVSGFMRLFYYNEEGDEVTTHINCPPGFITTYQHFVNQTPAAENVACVTACELLRITQPNLHMLTTVSPALKDFSIWVFQQSMVYNEQRSKQLATLTAEQRYQQLMIQYPQILQHVPLQYIASFLGMNAKSLSRIRKQMIK